MNRKIAGFILLALQMMLPFLPFVGGSAESVPAECGNIRTSCQSERITLELVDRQIEKCAASEIAGSLEALSELPYPTPEFEPEPKPRESIIENFPIIWQMPELPTGCEVTALTMVLRFYGYGVSKTEMAGQHLPTVSPYLSYGEDGTLYGPDLNRYFVGDPFSDWGYICGAPAILTATSNFLLEQGGGHTALDLTGAAPEELYTLVAQGTPVVVWVTIEMADRYTPDGWYTETGEYVDWSTNDHGAVLIGYSDETVTIADPISGQIEYSRRQFESVFESRGRQCVIISETQEAAV